MDGAAIVKEVEMIDSVLHKVSTNILAVKKLFHSILLNDFPNSCTLGKIIGRHLVCLVPDHQCWQLAMSSHHIEFDEGSDSMKNAVY